MKAILVLVLGLLLLPVGCGGNGNKGGGGSSRSTDTTAEHGQVASVVLKGNVESIQAKAEKFNLMASTGEMITVKVHPTVFIWHSIDTTFDVLQEGQAVTVIGLQNPGIVKADTVIIGL